MIIEFTGCSGSGKTTLREAVVKELAHQGQLAYCPMTALLGSRLATIRNWPRLGNLLIDARIFPKFILTQIFQAKSPYHAFQQHCRRTIAQHGSSRFEQVRLLRSLTRKLALHANLSAVPNREKIVLVDEGITHLAHILHGRNLQTNATAQNKDALCEFSKLAPRPDLLVWVQAPLELLELRIQQRNQHQPLPGQSPENRQEFLRRADTLIQTVVNSPSHSSRVLVIKNHQQNLHHLKHHAQHVADAIGKLSLTRHPEHALPDQQSIHAA